jgi:iron complex transport system permease protein
LEAKNPLKKTTAFALLIILLIILLTAACVVGSVKIPLGEIVSIIRGGGDETYRRVLLGIRVPRIVQAAIVGMGLSVSGTFLQGLLGNPLADPYILGVSSGSALGAAVSIVLGLGLLTTQMLAFLGALATIYLVISLSRLGQGTGSTTLLLSGIAVSTFLSAILSFIMLISHQQMSGIVFWMMGDFSLISWNEVFVSTPAILVGSFIMYLYSKELNAIIIGRETAEHLGVNTERVFEIILACGSLVTAAAVAVSGIVGFVGLMVPHITRMFVGPDNRVLVPFSALTGAMFLVFADALSRTLIQPSEIPIGIITAMFGGPFFIYILTTSKTLK